MSFESLLMVPRSAENKATRAPLEKASTDISEAPGELALSETLIDQPRKGFPFLWNSTLSAIKSSPQHLSTNLTTFFADHQHLEGIEFIERLLEHFQLQFQTRWDEKELIPPQGKVIIIANNPLGGLDAAALFKLVSDVRSDVKVLVSEAVHASPALNDITLPFVYGAHKLEQDDVSLVSALPTNNQSTNNQNLSNKNINKEALDHLESDGALIFFPANDLARFSPLGLSDSKWRSDFLRLAKDTQSPILPVHIDAAHSVLLSGVSAISKPLSTKLAASDIYKRARRSMMIRIGRLIAPEAFSGSILPIKTQVKLFKKHLHKIGKGKAGIWPTQSPIAHPEPRQQLRKLIASQQHLGETVDNKQIYLYQNQGSCSVLREIGRLREIAFRAVGEGSGERRDIDSYDGHYQQLVLWDDQDLEVVGAYRLAPAKTVIDTQGLAGLYSASLFTYHPSVIPMLEQGLELGRSFVQPRYWGKRSLDYLWYGIGSYLRQHPEIRYLFGPVSISNDLPKAAKDLLVYFFTLHFGSFDEHSGEPLALSKKPYRLSNELVADLSQNFHGKDYKQDFMVLKNILSNMGCSVPTLYKQYSELCEPGGVKFLGFGVDPDFGDCIDGLVLVDVTKLKPKKRKRYMPDLATDE